MLRWVGSEGNLGAPDRQRLFFPDNIEPREEGAREVGGGGDRKSLSAFQPLLPWIWQISNLRDGYCRLAKLMSSWEQKPQVYFFASWWRGCVTQTADYTQDIYLHAINTFQPLINTVWITRCSWKAKESLELRFSSLWGSIAIKRLPLPEWVPPPPFSLHQCVRKMSCLRAGLPNTWKTTSESKKTDHRGRAKQRFSQVSLSELWKLSSCVRVGKFCVNRQSATSLDQFVGA